MSDTVIVRAEALTTFVAALFEAAGATDRRAASVELCLREVDDR